MAEPTSPFPVSEYTARVDALQREMARNELDALLLTAPADIFYVTGFLTRFWESPARPWFVLVPAAGEPVAIIPSIGAPLMRRCWIGDIRTWDAPHPTDDGISLLAEAVAGHVPRRGTLGVPMGAETHMRMPMADYGKLLDAIAPRRVADGTAALHRTREIKTDAEIAAIRQTCAVAGRAFARLPDRLAVGHGLDTVARSFQGLLLEEGCDWVSYLAAAAGPRGYEDVISTAGPLPLQAGDVMMLDTGAVLAGYFCDFDRNYSIGPPSDAVRRVQHALWDVTEDALERLRPGMRAREVHGILQDGLVRRGATPCSGRLGHGLGTTLTEWPSFTPLDYTELRAGMVLTLEPSAYVDGARFLTHEENIVLREDGPALLSPRAPRDMVEIAV